MLRLSIETCQRRFERRSSDRGSSLPVRKRRLSVRADQDGSEVVAHFAGGRSARADLLIGGDGIRSGVRAQVAPQVQPIYAGYYIWRGAPNEADLASETLASIFPYFAFFLPERQRCGMPCRERSRASSDRDRRALTC